MTKNRQQGWRAWRVRKAHVAARLRSVQQRHAVDPGGGGPGRHPAGAGTLTRFSGIDATLGLAFAQAGFLYPFFGTLLGWLGVALTGSDTASNVLFGGLQKITAEQLGLSPILMGAANSSGGVMGKMIDAQSIVVASTPTNWFGHEGTILRFVFKHSIPLACLGGRFVRRQPYAYPITPLPFPNDTA